MQNSIPKSDLEQKLENIGVLFEKTKDEQEKNALREQAYWLEEALLSSAPNTVLNRAFSFWERTNGKAGLKPFETALITPGIHSYEVTVRHGETLWGILYRAFQSGSGFDDRHVTDIFNRLPPAAQTHIIDTVEHYMRTRVEEDMRVKIDKSEASHTTLFNISDSDAVKGGDVINLGPILTDENVLLDLVEKTKETAKIKEEAVQKNARNIADWLRHHETAPHTEQKLEEVLYGLEAANVCAKAHPDEIQKLFTKAEGGIDLTPDETETVDSFLPTYERKIRDRLCMSTSEYLRMRSVTIEKLLDAVPQDPAQLALVTRSAVRHALLNVPEGEFHKRVRTAAIIRSYSFGKELRSAAIRQFFRGIV